MDDSNERISNEQQTQDAPACLLSPAEKKAQVEQMEQRLRRIKAQADVWYYAAQEELDDLRARQRDACARGKVKVQSAERALKQAEDHLELCCTELLAKQNISMQAILAVEDAQRKQRCEMDAQIKEVQQLIDKTADDGP